MTDCQITDDKLNSEKLTDVSEPVAQITYEELIDGLSDFKSFNNPVSHEDNMKSETDSSKSTSSLLPLLSSLSFISTSSSSTSSELEYKLPEVLKEEIEKVDKSDLNDVEKKILMTFRTNKSDNIFITMDDTANKQLIYLINAFERINTKLKKTQVIIVMPTINLCNKIYRLARDLFKNTGIRIRSSVNTKINQGYRIKDHILICTITFLEMIKLSNSFQPKDAQIIFDEFDVFLTFKKIKLSVNRIITRHQLDNQLVFFSLSRCPNVLHNVRKHTSSKLIKLDLIDKDNNYLKNMIHFKVTSEPDDCFDLLVEFLKNIKNSARVVIYTLSKLKLHS